jgi:drug/metabolite transporter (DMT)-like permease
MIDEPNVAQKADAMSANEETAHAPVDPVLWLFLILSISCQTAAVIFGKTAALRMGAPGVRAFLTNGWYLAALACLFLQALFWQAVLRGIRLFVAYLFTSLNYLLVLAVSRIIFLERVTTMNVIGAAVIVAGVYVVVREDLT